MAKEATNHKPSMQRNDTAWQFTKILAEKQTAENVSFIIFLLLSHIQLLTSIAYKLK